MQQFIIYYIQETLKELKKKRILEKCALSTSNDCYDSFSTMLTLHPTYLSKSGGMVET